MAKYDENSIKILEGLDAVRKRPGMYIGSTDKRGLHHLVWEIVDNSIDEVINGFGKKIKITIHNDGSLSVVDEGRGVPVGMHASGKSTPEVIYTVLHAGGKFEAGGYKVSGGLHGVGGSVVNALSEWMEVNIKREGHEYFIRFKDGGKLDVPLKEIGNTNKTGTRVRFMPDSDIFEVTRFSYSTICERMQECSFLLKNITIEVVSEEDGKSEVFHYENGLEAFVDYLNDGKSSLHKTVMFESRKDKINVAVAFQYTDTYSESIISFVNNVKTNDGGTHEVGFKTGITKAFNEYARMKGLLKEKDPNLDGIDIRSSMTAILSIKIPESLLQFESQTKSKLGTPDAKIYVEQVISEQLKFYLSETGEVANLLINNAIRSYKIREAQLEKVPYMLVIGDKEVESGMVGVRSRKEGDLGAVLVEEFIEKVRKEVVNYER